MLFWNFIIILILVALNGFFVSVEFAAVTSRRAKIELLAESGNGPAQVVKTWLENPAARDRLIAGSQLGITIVSLALGSAGEKAFEGLLAPYFDSLVLPVKYTSLAPLLAVLPLIFSLLIVTSLHVVLGEQVPKVAALHNPEGFAMLAARPMQLFTRVFKWFIDILDWATRQILTTIGLKMAGEHAVAHLFASAAFDHPAPADILFLDDSVYAWRILDEYAISAYWVGKYEESLRANDRLLAEGKLPATERPRVEKNRAFCLGKLGPR